MVKNYFQYGSRPPSWIFKIFIFVHMTVIEFQVCRCVPNFHQNQISFRWDMTIFMMALAIFNLWNLEFMLCPLYRRAIPLSCAKFSLKSDNRLLRYGQKRFSTRLPSPFWILIIFTFDRVTFVELQICFVYQISSKSDDFSLRCGDLTIFKMTDARHLEV